MRWGEEIFEFGGYAEDRFGASATLSSVNLIQKVLRALKDFSLAGHPWSRWDLEMKLQRRRFSDPALSWADRCEGPSTR